MRTKILRFISLCAFLVFGAAFAFTGIAYATSVLQMSDEELVQQSALIVEARVIGLASGWNARHTQILTRVNLAVTDVLKGTPPEAVMQLVVLGGVVGDTAMAIVEAPGFEVGEDTLLMLNGNPRSLFPVVGFNQGKFTFDSDAATGVARVRGRATDRSSFLRHIRDLAGR